MSSLCYDLGDKIRQREAFAQLLRVKKKAEILAIKRAKIAAHQSANKPSGQYPEESKDPHEAQLSPADILLGVLEDVTARLDKLEIESQSRANAT